MERLVDIGVSMFVLVVVIIRELGIMQLDVSPIELL